MGDILAVEWQRAREERSAIRGALLGALLESITWIPILLVLAEQWAIVGACVLGSGLGSYLGIRRLGAIPKT